MAKIVLVTIGSWGDLFPFIGAGIALCDRGHEVVLASTRHYAAIVGDAGLTFLPLGPPPTTDPGPSGMRDTDPRVLDRRLGGLIGLRYIWRTSVLPHLDSHVDTLRAAAVDADIVVGHPLALAAPITADA